MNATVTYRMVRRATQLAPNVDEAWVLERRIIDVRDVCIKSDDIAVFNFESDAQTFARHVFDGGVIEIDAELAEHFKLVDQARARRSQ